VRDVSRTVANLPTEQEVIRAKCFHPSGTFIEFTEKEVEQSIPERFERIAHQYPDQIAVKAGTQIVTYSELNAAANRTARAILARRGDPVEPVGLLFANTAHLAAAMLGVLKAGKFFVLLDPFLPKTRQVLILKNSQAELVVAEQQTALQTSAITPTHQRLLFEALDLSTSSDDLQLETPALALAYVVYTSGSTGQPKGVIQSHRNLLHRVRGRTNTRHLCAADRIAHLTAGTSNAITNIFLALLNGATLLPFSVRTKGTPALAQWLATEKVSYCRIGAPLFRGLCESLTGAGEFSDLRLIELTSDTILKSDIDLYKNNFANHTILFTALSSTETGLLTDFLIDHDSEIAGDDVPVGYPAEDKEISVLDDNGNAAGVNEIGEIVVRSRFLSPGYWREPELTSAKFKAEPNDGQYTRYRTGDLGLIRADGSIVHKGRKDLRARVRGYGVEIAEVEQVLRAHAEIKDAIVVRRQNDHGESYLAAYFTSCRGRAPGVSELHSFLNAKLPAYMIPSVFEILDEIPLTPNGKVDRNALPAPARTRPHVGAPFVTARTAIEQALVKIWQTVLCLDQVGIRDNFFDLGGHSLAATRVVSQVIQQFQIEVPLQLLFQSPTVAEMAAVITEHQAKKLGRGDLERILADLESISDEEAQRLLSGQAVTERR
jgi:amino acid adenylation domain-containing protein